MLRVYKNKDTSGELGLIKRILKAKIKSKVKRMRASSEPIPSYPPVLSVPNQSDQILMIAEQPKLVPVDMPEQPSRIRSSSQRGASKQKRLKGF